MAFSWKDKADIYKGEGIYHLTFGVVNRKPLLGTLRPVEIPDSKGHIAWIDGTELGRYVYQHFNELTKEYPQMQILGKQIMPNHFHAVVWMHEGFEGSIKMVARGFAQGCSKEARRLEAKRREQQAGGAQTAAAPAVRPAVQLVDAQSNCAIKTNGIGKHTTTEAATLNRAEATTLNRAEAETPIKTEATTAIRIEAATPIRTEATTPIRTEVTTPAAQEAQPLPYNPYDCGNGANTLFEKPFIRTLAHRGQLLSMIHYVHDNPDHAWIRHSHPEYYTIHRNIERGGLHFDTMGKERLLDWPDRQVITLSRSLTQEQIAEEVQHAMRMAESGTVTYTAAINMGEKAVAKAIREAGYPLVVMMIDGFPPAGTEAARYYHPGGVYHKACGTGQLLLMAPLVENYMSPTLIALTEAELQQKAAAKHQYYTPLPHTSKRWRMIAGNIMLRTIAQ